ncbi:hypothetical protein Tco_0025318 [Tanacetum coccineum]
MNEKSKYTAKARQDLKRLGIRSGLWLGQTKNGKCSKPQAAYSFTPENRKKFCQFIKGVKLPDGFGSNFKHTVTDNDTNIMSLKSHDCHIMMQRLLPYGLQQYLHDEVAKPIIELCSFFKKICSVTLMEDDMLKAQSKTQFDLKPHIQSQRWTDINAGIQQHLQKLYNINKASLKAAHWVINPETGRYDMERSSTREYPSLIDTFFVTHTVGEVFVQDEDRALYDEMLRLHRLSSNIETGVPYTEEEIMAIVRKGKQRGHLPSVGRVLSGHATSGCPPPPQSTVDPAEVEKLKKSNKSLTKQVKMITRLFRSDDKFSQMLDQFESSPEFGGASGSGGCKDDEPSGDEEGDEDEEDDDIRDVIYMDNARTRAPPSRSGKSPGKKSMASFPLQLIPGYMSPGIGFPSDMSPGKGSKCRWG